VSEANLDDFTAVILAGGRSRRMKSDIPKALQKVGGTPMIGMVYDAAIRSGIKRCVVVTGFGAELVKQYLGEKAEYAHQSEQLGTGHALSVALDYLGDFNGRIISLFSDMPLISPRTLAALAAQNKENREHATIAYANMKNPYGFGRIVRGADGGFARMIEQRDVSAEEDKIAEANVGVFSFEASAARFAAGRLGTNNAQGEMYLTDMFEILAGAGMRVGLHEVADGDEFLAADDRAALAEISAIIRKNKCAGLMLESGVTIIDPNATYIDSGVSVGMDTVIHPGCVIEGRCAIGAGCEIGPNARISDSDIGDGVKIQYSVITDARVGDGVSIGPFSYLRPGASVGQGTKIGDFVEIKNSSIGRKTSISHHAYVGDSDVGSNVNIGCGVITCNYDGRQKHRTVIGDNAFIGSNVNLIAPVTVSAHAYIASGSTITDDVPEDALAIARERQSIKENWVSKKGLTRG